MKALIYLLFVCSAFSTTLTNKEGVSIEVENLSYDGKLLSGQMNGRSITFDPNLLSEESWAAVQKELIDSQPVSVRFQKTANKKEFEEYNIDIGSTAPVERGITIHYFVISGEEYLSTSKKVKIERSHKGAFKIKRTVVSLDTQDYCNVSVGGEFKQFFKFKRLELLVVVTNNGKVLGEHYNTNGGKAILEKLVENGVLKNK